jgi:hypothetical protein
VVEPTNFRYDTDVDDTEVDQSNGPELRSWVVDILLRTPLTHGVVRCEARYLAVTEQEARCLALREFSHMQPEIYSAGADNRVYDINSATVPGAFS